MEQKTGGARVCALKILYKIEQEGAFANIALKEAAGCGRCPRRTGAL